MAEVGAISRVQIGSEFCIILLCTTYISRVQINTIYYTVMYHYAVLPHDKSIKIERNKVVQTSVKMEIFQSSVIGALADYSLHEDSTFTRSNDKAVLEQNPKFRAIHSGASVQKIIEKVGPGGAEDSCFTCGELSLLAAAIHWYIYDCFKCPTPPTMLRRADVFSPSQKLKAKVKNS